MDLNNPDRERPERFCENHEPWETFSTAIVKAAIDDYKVFTGRARQQIERFFKTVFFSNISSIDPDWLIKNLREMYPVRTGMIKGE